MTDIAQQIKSTITINANYIKDFPKEVVASNVSKDVFNRFISVHEVLLKAVRLLVDVSKHPMRLETLNVANKKLQDVTEYYRRISEYIYSNKDIEGLINSLNTSFHDFMLDADKWLVTSMIVQSNSTEDEIAKHFKDVNELLGSIREREKEANKIKSEMEELLKASKETANETVIVEYSKIFDDEAKGHRKASFVWLSAIVVLIIVLFCFVDEYMIDNSNYFSGNLLFSVIASRIIIFSALFIALSLCIKNFKASRHNEILNKHRRNALKTFKTFVLSSKDDNQTKNAILLEVTRTIFSNQNTGYASADSDGEPNKIIEIIKNISNTKQ